MLQSGSRPLQPLLTEVVQHVARAGSRFVDRADAIEMLELHLFSRPDAESHAAYVEANALKQRLEAANERVVRRLATRIRAGRFTHAGLRRALARLARDTHGRDYDALDLLLASLFDAGSFESERVVLEPEMVAYQPTPGRAILDLLERADLRAHDVFVDLGSGLGWVVLLVACLSEARAIGIELEPTYCDAARGCARQLNLARAEFVQADARVAFLQHGTVYFMYTPFRGAMLRRVLARLRTEAAQRAIRVCSYGPCTLELARESWLQPRAAGVLGEDELVVFDPRM
jgi:predicted RNA methylase